MVILELIMAKCKTCILGRNKGIILCLFINGKTTSIGLVSWSDFRNLILNIITLFFVFLVPFCTFEIVCVSFGKLNYSRRNFDLILGYGICIFLDSF